MVKWHTDLAPEAFEVFSDFTYSLRPVQNLWQHLQREYKES